MERRTFIGQSCTSGLVSLLGVTELPARQVQGGSSETAKKHVPQAMSEAQVRNILKYIDTSQVESVKESVFEQLGYECFFSRGLDKWIDQYVDNVPAFDHWEVDSVGWLERRDDSLPDARSDDRFRQA